MALRFCSAIFPVESFFYVIHARCQFMTIRKYLLAIILCILSAQSGNSEEISRVAAKRTIITNDTAYIPSQCYTKTESSDTGKRIFNPCYVCHTRYPEPNYVNDQALQRTYSFPESALENPWHNLFEDRTARISGITDQEIDTYIAHSNYLDSNGDILLKKRLRNLPPSWDYNGNGTWDGYTPDCWFTFDSQGFDRGPGKSYSGWRAFAYYPFPGISWPTNGSTDDVLIRLPENFRTSEQGEFDLRVYQTNLAIVEAVVSRKNISIEPTDEREFGVDLDKDGKLATADQIVFGWDPGNNISMSYVGQAKVDLQQGLIHLAAGLFPVGTEFLNSVRYVDCKSDGETTLSPRMKELRYMKKRTWRTYSDLEESALNEVKERNDFPDRTRQFVGDSEHGINNNSGWLLQGFVEDNAGNLRPQSFEETAYCIGCHGGTGATTDAIYSFTRKVDSSHFQAGWFHWTQKGMKGLNEPKIHIRNAGVYYEYSYYLMYNGSGGEFRHNPEVEQTFFHPDGIVRKEKIDQLHDDISILLNPSRDRARLLNKAYRTIVIDQDFTDGRDVNVARLTEVYEVVEQDLATGVNKATSIDSFGSRFGTHINTAWHNSLYKGGITEISQQEKLKTDHIGGNGMKGPSGKKYEVDWQGVIHKSNYSLGISHVHFTFPPRNTLPTRFIVPPGKNRRCYTCHRLDYPGTQSPANLSNIIDPVDNQAELTANMTRLTENSGRDLNGVWSPDRSRIAYVSNRSGADQLWIMNTDGSNKRQLTSGPATAAWPQWSPDAKTVVYLSYNQQTETYSIECVDINSGKQESIIHSRSPLARPGFHPDGTAIVYAAQIDSNWDIWLIERSTARKYRLTSDPQMETNPLWRPDGKALAFKVAPVGEYPLTEEYFMTFEQGYGSPTIYFWSGPQSVQMSDWSPDGKKITYTAEIISDSYGEDRVTYAAMISDISFENNLAVMKNTKILSKGMTLGDRGPVFSPDGKAIAFWAWDTSANATLWLYSISDDRTSRLTSDGNDMYPQWSPDGRWLLFSSTRAGNSDVTVLSVQSHTASAQFDTTSYSPR